MSDDSTSTDTLSSDRNLPFLFVMAYLPDSVNSNQLLFEMARYNFTNFTVRNFELNIEQQPGITRLLTSGFLNYDEALQYARKLYANESMRTLIQKCRCIIISDHNLSLIGTRYSYQDYDEFYQRTFAPLTISNEELLEIPEVIEQPDEENEQDNSQEKTPTPADNKNTNDFDEDFW